MIYSSSLYNLEFLNIYLIWGLEMLNDFSLY